MADTLYGWVNSDAGPQTSGYTAEKNGTGAYTVIFDNPFSSAPIVLLTGIDDDGNTRNTTADQVSAGSFQVTIKNNQGDNQNAGFYFSATDVSA